MNQNNLSRSSLRRHGGILADVIVGATLLVCAITMVATITIRSGRILQDTRQQHLALDELSNQLDYLLSLDPTQLGAESKNLSPSRHFAERYPYAVLESHVHRDDDGERVVVHIKWQTPFAPAPMTLVGWTNPQSAGVKSK